MKGNQILLIALLFISNAFTYAQTNFSFTPQRPKAGDVITFIYEPAGAITGIKEPIDALVYFYGTKDGFNDVQQADNIILKQKGNQYVGTIKTDSIFNFLSLGFSAENKFDNNNGDGYYILLYEGDKVKKGTYLSLSLFYGYNEVGAVDKNGEKEFQALQQELNLYPKEQHQALFKYINLVQKTKKDEASAIVQKVVESLLKEGLKSERDYERLETIYNIASLTNQAAFVASLKKEKYPTGRWQADEAVRKLVKETESAIARALLEEIVRKSQTDSNWQHWQPKINILQSYVYNAYNKKKDWEGIKQYLSIIKDKPQLITFYQKTALSLLQNNTDIKYAEELSRMAVEYAKKEMVHATKKPAFTTPKQWEQQRRLTYALCADTYARVLHQLAEWKKALSYSQEAVKITNGENADYNATYAVIAEKVLPIKQFKENLEGFVQRGKSTPEVNDVLKRAYVKEKKSEAGFSGYFAALQKGYQEKTADELRKRMKNETAPDFTLRDLEGNEVSISDWKGSVVVIDFWATWCGPCIRSFPALQKIINKYKDSTTVKFVFIDTQETSQDTRKNAADFLTKNNYKFYVLIDEQNKVAEQFKVEGIPEKFVIDRNGMIRFRSGGYTGDDHKLIAELTAMIEITSKL